MQPSANALVLTPVSATVAALLHQLQAQVLNDIHAANDGRSVPPGAAVVLPLGAGDCQQYWESVHGARIVMCRFKNGGRVTLRSFRGDATYPDVNPGAWYGQEHRIDESGREWESRIEPHVMDDFGTLVPSGAL